MRKRGQRNGIHVKTYTGSNAVLLAMNLPEERRKGLLGFAIEREQLSNGKRQWLQGLLHFPGVSREPGEPTSTQVAPIQRFRWSDYTVRAGEKYRYVVHAVYGTPDRLRLDRGPSILVHPQTVLSGKQIVHFNRAAAASQAFSRTFRSVDRAIEEARRAGTLSQYQLPPRALKWLSDGLLEQILAFLARATDGTWTLDIAIYEYELEAIAKAVEAAHQRGVKVRVVYHAKRGDKQTAINEDHLRGIPDDLKRPRITSHICHHKFIVLSRLRKEGVRQPVSVLCGSANFTENGVYRQANVVHILDRKEIATEYGTIFEQLFQGATPGETRRFITAHDPIDLRPPIFAGFSPRATPEDLQAFISLIQSARRDVLFCTSFNLDDEVENALIGAPHDQVLRYGLENTRSRITGFHADRTASFVATAMLKEGLEGFLRESTRGQRGNILVHTKAILVDFTSENPIVISGSHNYSKTASHGNDENYLILRADPDVADAYGCELLRIYDHYRFRFRVMQPARARNGKPFALDPTDQWTEDYFRPGSLKAADRERFCDLPDRT